MVRPNTAILEENIGLQDLDKMDDKEEEEEEEEEEEDESELDSSDIDNNIDNNNDSEKEDIEDRSDFGDNYRRLIFGSMGDI